MRYEVYKIQNTVNNKIYIGITTQGYKARYRSHLSEASRGSDFKLYRAIRKYGEDKFKLSLLETVETLDVMKVRESFWIEALKSTDDNFGYNMTKGGDGTFGRLHSDETKGKISEKALMADSIRHVKVTALIISTNQVLDFKTIQEAALFFDIRANILAIKLSKSNVSLSKDDLDYLLIKRDDLKSEPKPKFTKRDPDQVAEHMLNMQAKSAKSREGNDSWKQKIQETKLEKGMTKIVQQWKGEELVAEYPGVREAVRLNEGFNRSGLQHCLKGRNSSYKGFVWKFKE
jgi:group I intron endonuclease